MGRLKKSEKKVGCSHSAEETRTNARIPPLIHPSVRRFPFGVPSGVLRVVPYEHRRSALGFRVPGYGRPFALELRRRPREDRHRYAVVFDSGRVIRVRIPQRRRPNPYGSGLRLSFPDGLDPFQILRRFRSLFGKRRSGGVRNLRLFGETRGERRAFSRKRRERCPPGHLYGKRRHHFARIAFGFRNRPQMIAFLISRFLRPGVPYLGKGERIPLNFPRNRTVVQHVEKSVRRPRRFQDRHRRRN